MDTIIQGNPAITTEQAARSLVGHLATLDLEETRACYAELAYDGLKVRWRHFTRQQRDKALTNLRAATLKQSADGLTLEAYMQAKLPLPDADLAPTMGEATVFYLLRAAAYLRQMQRTTGEQAQRLELAASLLAAAAERAGEPDLTLGPAVARGLIDRAALVA